MVTRTKINIDAIYEEVENCIGGEQPNVLNNLKEFCYSSNYDPDSALTICEDAGIVDKEGKPLLGAKWSQDFFWTYQRHLKVLPHGSEFSVEVFITKRGEAFLDRLLRVLDCRHIEDLFY